MGHVFTEAGFEVAASGRKLLEVDISITGRGLHSSTSQLALSRFVTEPIQSNY